METVAIDWTYAISTLIIRFVGIFVVLGILQIVMNLTGKLFSYLDAKDAVAAGEKSKREPASMTDEEAAAVGMALYLFEQKR